jgi:DNA-directed RNA polymerase specialized sigma subunit
VEIPVIIATVLHDQKEQEVADEIGISQPAIHQIKNRALEKLRNHY